MSISNFATGINIMIKTEDKLKKLAEVLEKGTSKSGCKAIGLLREEPPFKGVISLLASFYNSTDDFQIRKAIEEFFNNLKDKAVAEEVIIELRKQLKPDTLCMLVSSCWQSGLDYSDYVLDFAEVFLRGDYVTAFECLTVIEESVDDLSSSKKDEVLAFLEKFPVSPGSEKAALSSELLLILKR